MVDILYVSSSYLQTSSTNVSSIKCQTVSCIVDLYSVIGNNIHIYNSFKTIASV